MGKQKHSWQKHHLYLGIGGMVAVAALVVALTFGLSSAQEGSMPPPPPPPSGDMSAPPPPPPPPPSGDMSAPPPGGQYTPPPGGQTPPPGGQTPPPGGQTPPPGGQTPPPGGSYCWDGRLSTPEQPCTSPPQGWQPTTGGQTPPTGTQQYPNMRQCGPNEQPTPQNPCAMSGTGQYQSGQQPQQCGQGMHYATGMGCVRDLLPGEQPNQYPNQQMPNQQMPNQQMQNQSMQPSNDMQQCPNPMDPSNTIWFPKTMRKWDSATQKEVVKENATCADFQSMMTGPQNQMGGQGQMQRPFFNGQMNGQQNGQMNSQQMMNPCQYNPTDPICQSGFDFQGLSQQYQFDQSQFDPTQYETRNLKQELRNLKMESKSWIQDVKQVEQQLKEVQRESSSVVCPTSVEVNAVLQQLKDAHSMVNGLSDGSSKEDIQKGLALRDFVNGIWENGMQTTQGLKQKLFGGPPDEDGNQVRGLMQKLDGCRQLSGTVRNACQTSKEITKEIQRMKSGGMDSATVAVFEDGVKKLNNICTNPLQEVSIDELTNWQPPEECQGFGFGGPGFGGPGMGGPGMGGPGMGGPGMGGPGMMGPQFGPQMQFNDMPPELMDAFKQKFEQMQQFQGNNFGASVLSAQSKPVFGEDDAEFSDDESQFGPPEEALNCMPPLEKKIQNIMQGLMKARFAAEQHFNTANTGKFFEMCQKQFAQEKASGQMPLSEDDKDRVEEICFTEGPAAVEAGDMEEADFLRQELFSYFQRAQQFGGGKGKNSLVDIDQLIEDKLASKLREKFGDDTTSASQKKIAQLEAQLAEATAKLSDLQKTIIALSEQLSDMTTKLTSALGNNVTADATQAIGTITQLPKEAQNTVSSNIAEIAPKIEQLKELLPAKEDAMLDTTMKTLLKTPPSSLAQTQINEELTALASYVQSGATKAEVSAKTQDTVAEILALDMSPAEVANKVKENLVAFPDTASYDQWFAASALRAKQEGLISSTLTKMEPASPESKCAAITRVARVAEKAGELTIDMTDKAPVAGAPEWCLPFVHALEDQPLVAGLSNPNGPADRLFVAKLIHQTLGSELPEVPEGQINNYLTPDTQGLSAEDKEAVATVRFNGLMDKVNDTDFGANVTFNRAQNALVGIKTLDVLQSAATGE